MKVREVMSRDPVKISPDETAAVAARLLSHHNIGALPVCTKEGKLRGVITDRDIVLRCVAANEDPQSVKVSEIMTRRIVSVNADTSVETASELMAHEQIRRLPVEDSGKIIGMLSLGDLAKLPDFTTEAAQTLGDISLNTRHA